MIPRDFQLEYYWRGGTLPPPYHYEFRIRLDASGRGDVVFHPDYPSEQPPEWREPFSVTPMEVRRLYHVMREQEVLECQWEQIPDGESPLGGELESLEVVVNAQSFTVPSGVLDASRIGGIYRVIRSLVPETIWRSLMDRREEYVREQLGE